MASFQKYLSYTTVNPKNRYTIIRYGVIFKSVNNNFWVLCLFVCLFPFTFKQSKHKNKSMNLFPVKEKRNTFMPQNKCLRLRQSPEKLEFMWQSFPNAPWMLPTKYALDKFCNFLLLHSWGVLFLPWAQILTQRTG